MDKTNPACAECQATRAMVGSLWLYCPDCDEVYCGRACWNEHTAVCEKLKMHREQGRKWEPLFDSHEAEYASSSVWRCPACQKTYLNPNMTRPRCTCCNQIVCSDCFQLHREASGHTHEATHCAWCGKATHVRIQCLCCDLPLCPECYQLHDLTRAQKQQEQSRSYEYTFNFDPGQADDFLKWMFGNMGQTYRGPFTRGGSAPSSLPRHVQDAYKTLGLAGSPSAEQVREAFRAKVKAAADGKGGYRGDMDKLRKAKEAALQYAESRRS